MSFIRRILEVVIGTIIALVMLAEMADAVPYEINKGRVCESEGAEFIFPFTKDPGLIKQAVQFGMLKCSTTKDPCLAGLTEVEPKILEIECKPALKDKIPPRKREGIEAETKSVTIDKET